MSAPLIQQVYRHASLRSNDIPFDIDMSIGHANIFMLTPKMVDHLLTSIKLSYSCEPRHLVLYIVIVSQLLGFDVICDITFKKGLYPHVEKGQVVISHNDQCFSHKIATHDNHGLTRLHLHL